MIYVPDLENYKCYVVRDTNTLRAYKKIPEKNSEIEYRDYYINSHYLYQDGIQSFGSYTTYLPVCLDNKKLTTLYNYRNDFADIMIIYAIMTFTIWFLSSKLIKTFFRGFRRY